MKEIILISAWLVALGHGVWVYSRAPAYTVEHGIVGTVVQVSGDVQFRPMQTVLWIPAKSGTALATGTSLVTQSETMAVLEFSNGDLLRVGPNSLVMLAFPREMRGQGALVELVRGSMGVIPRSSVSLAAQPKPGGRLWSRVAKFLGFVDSTAEVRVVVGDTEAVVVDEKAAPFVATRQMGEPGNVTSFSDVSDLEEAVPSLQPVAATDGELLMTDLAEVPVAATPIPKLHCESVFGQKMQAWTVASGGPMLTSALELSFRCDGIAVQGQKYFLVVSDKDGQNQRRIEAAKYAQDRIIFAVAGEHLFGAAKHRGLVSLKVEADGELWTTEPVDLAVASLGAVPVTGSWLVKTGQLSVRGVSGVWQWSMGNHVPVAEFVMHSRKDLVKITELLSRGHSLEIIDGRDRWVSDFGLHFVSKNGIIASIPMKSRVEAQILRKQQAVRKLIAELDFDVVFMGKKGAWVAGDRRGDLLDSCRSNPEGFREVRTYSRAKRRLESVSVELARRFPNVVDLYGFADPEVHVFSGPVEIIEEKYNTLLNTKFEITDALAQEIQERLTRIRLVAFSFSERRDISFPTTKWLNEFASTMFLQQDPAGIRASLAVNGMDIRATLAGNPGQLFEALELTRGVQILFLLSKAANGDWQAMTIGRGVDGSVVVADEKSRQGFLRSLLAALGYNGYVVYAAHPWYVVAGKSPCRRGSQAAVLPSLVLGKMASGNGASSAAGVLECEAGARSEPGLFVMRSVAGEAATIAPGTPVWLE